MSPHPRIRKTIKWAGAAVTVLLVVVWIGSIGFEIQYAARGGVNVGALSGVTYIGRASFPDDYGRFGFDVRSVDRRIVFWHFSWQCNDGWDGWPTWLLMLPGWVLVVASSLPTILAWRLDTLAHRRAKLNLCPNCHYDRSGLGSTTVCPECGTPA